MVKSVKSYKRRHWPHLKLLRANIEVERDIDVPGLRGVRPGSRRAKRIEAIVQDVMRTLKKSRGTKEARDAFEADLDAEIALAQLEAAMKRSE